MDLKTIQSEVIEDLKKVYLEEWIEDSQEILEDLVKMTIDKTQEWISEKDNPAPIGVHLLVSINGVNLSGILCHKDPQGVWKDVYGKKLIDQGFVKYYRYPVIDTD